MVKWIKLVFLMIFLLVFANYASAEINLYVNSRNVYNLNDNVELSASVRADEDLRGFLKASVECDNYGVDYYILPIVLSAGQTEMFSIPPLNLFENMLGTCRIKVSVLDNNLNLVEDKYFNEFNVVDDLSLSINLNKEEFLPGEELVIEGKVNNFIGQGLENYNVIFYFDDNKIEEKEYHNSEFTYEIRLEDNIKSNSHVLKFEIQDDYGNKGNYDLEFFVKPVPTKLENKINKLEFLPGEEVAIGTSLYDQAGELIYSNVNVKIYDPKNDVILDKSENTDTKIYFTLGKYAIPGAYKIATKDENFEIEGKFYVREVKDVNIYINNGKLFIKNEGNVKFKDEVFVDLGEEYSFFENVNLGVGEEEEIKLVDKFSEGEYDLNVFANGENSNLGTFYLRDDRTPSEKAGNMITGNATKGFDFMVSTGIIYILILLVVLLVLWYYLTFKRRETRVRERGVRAGRRARERLKAQKGLN